jgi:putative heme iron utilization protein
MLKSCATSVFFSTSFTFGSSTKTKLRRTISTIIVRKSILDNNQNNLDLKRTRRLNTIMMSTSGDSAGSGNDDDDDKEFFEMTCARIEKHRGRKLSNASECKTILDQPINSNGVLSTMMMTKTMNDDENNKNNSDKDTSSSLMFPIGSFCSFAIDEDDFGKPIFALSSMSQHTKDLMNTSSNASLIAFDNSNSNSHTMKADTARVTLIGKIEKISNDEERARAREQYLAKHPKAFWVDFGDFSWFKMQTIEEVKYIGGFGRAHSISFEEYSKAKIDPVRKFSSTVCSHMNEDHAGSTLSIVEMICGVSGLERAEMVEIDSLGMTCNLTMKAQNIGKVRIEWIEEALDRKAVKEQIVALTKKAATFKAAAAIE